MKRHPGKRVSILPLLFSWIEYPDNTSNLHNYGPFVNLTIEDVSIRNIHTIDKNNNEDG